MSSSFVPLLFALSALGQVPPAQLSGVVRDPQQAVVIGATVEVTCGDTTRRTTTAGDGSFVLVNLPEGECVLVAESAALARVSQAVRVPRADRVTITLPVRRLSSEVTVTAARGSRQTAFDTAEATSAVTPDELDARPHRLLMEVLREEPGIMVQQTTTAQTSPIIRGFTGQSNVYLIDGVRLNTSAWRPGPNQYTSWVGDGFLSHLEVVRGPGSVQYGSDALGGTVNVLPALPLPTGGPTRVGGAVTVGAASADRRGAGQAQLVVQGASAALRAGMSAQRVGDLRAGGGLDSRAAVTRFLGLPSSANGTRLPDTGYEQTSGFLNGSVRAGRGGLLSALYLHSDLTGSSRYDRIEGGEGVYASGFSPQRLDFAVLRYQHLRPGANEEWSGSFSVNRQADGRYEQRRPTATLDRQTATTTALGYQLETRRGLGRHALHAGTELYRERIDASRELADPVSGAAAPNRPDIPDGTGYTTFGVYASDSLDLGRVRLRGGVRYGRYVFELPADARLGVTADHVVQQAVTYSAGIVVRLTPSLNATFATGRGFRAANAADLGAIGLTGGGGFEIAPSRAAALGGQVATGSAAGAVSTGQPVQNLGPEIVYSFEPGLRFVRGPVSASVSVFDVEYLDSVQRTAIAFTSNVVGQTISGFEVVRMDANGLAYIAQDARPVATRVNAGHARMVGVEAEGSVDLTPAWRVRGFWSMLNGRLLDDDEYLRRMPPPIGGAALRWGAARGWVEGTVSFAAAQTRLNSGDLSDARIGALRTRGSIASYFNGTATDRGLVQNGVLVATGERLADVQQRLLGSASSAPLFTEGQGFLVYGLRGGLRLSPQVEAIVIGENLTDRNYRWYGSGADAPGINVELQLRYRF